MGKQPWLACLLILAQAKPLERAFVAGEAETFRVEMTVRSEAQGQRAEKIGARTYTTPFSISAEERITWRAARRVLSVHADGSAEIEETLDQFPAIAEPPPDAGADEKAKTDAALRVALREWSKSGRIVLRYRETPRGEIASLTAEAGPVLDAEPGVLTAWLRHATRPRAVLRGDPGRDDARWNEPRAVALPPWQDARGSESGEWTAGPFPELSGVSFCNLHVRQQIAAVAPAAPGIAEQGSARFHAESVSTVPCAGLPIFASYGSLMQATRSSSRDLIRTLAPVEGLPEPPQFRSRISIEIRITREGWPPR